MLRASTESAAAGSGNPSHSVPGSSHRGLRICALPRSTGVGLGAYEECRVLRAVDSIDVSKAF